MVQAEKPLVTITGISGYIGSHTTLLFLQDGGFRVRGTVRDKNNEAKIAPLRTAFGAELFNQLELVEADLDNEESLTNAINGSTYVVHIATAITNVTGGEEEYVRPAVNGTMSVMRACKQFGVRRCVITSSIASCIGAQPKPALINETHWTDPDRTGAYGKAKTLAEKAAWDFVAALPDGEKFEVVTILPGFVMGPNLRAEHFASGGWIKKLMTGEMEVIKADGCAAVDVRDVALAHLNGIKVAEAANKRFILIHSMPHYADYARPVIAKYAPLGWPICQNFAPEDPEAVISQFDNAASREVLGISYRDFATTMVEMADAMVAQGTVVKPQ